MAKSPSDAYIFQYELGPEDDLLILTLYHQLGLESQENHVECYNIIKEKTNFRNTVTNRVPIDVILRGNDINAVKLEYKLQSKHIDIGTLQPISARKSNRSTGFTKFVVSLQPFASVLNFDELEPLFKRVRDFDFIRIDNIKLNIEFFTQEGNGISASSVSQLVNVLEQSKFDLDKQKNRLNKLESEIQAHQDIIDEAQEIEQNLPTLREKQSLAQSQLNDIQKQLKETTKQLSDRNLSVKTETINVEMSSQSNGSQTQFKPIIDLPRWESDQGRSQRENVVRYIQNLKHIDKLKVIDQPGLIYLSLLKSNRSQVFDELNDSEKTNLEDFIKYLTKSYGGNPIQIRKELDNLKQRNEETYISFFRRVISTYLRSRDLADTPNISSITDTAQRADIKYLYIKGLHNQKIRNLILQNENTIRWEDLGTQGQTYSQVLTDETTINVIETPSVSQVDKTIIDMINNLVEQVNRIEVANNDFRCYRCGNRGHRARDCRANDKAVARYRRGRSRSVSGSRNNFRNRSWSRDRDRDRRPRSSSRGRDYYNRYDRRSRDNRSNSRDNRYRSYSRGRSPERRYHSRERGSSQEREKFDARRKRDQTPHYSFHSRSKSRDRSD